MTTPITPARPETIARPEFETPWEEFCFDNAEYFTAVRGRDPRRRTRIRSKTFAGAVAYGAHHGDGRTMVYAVTAAGRFAHITNA